MKSLFQFQPNDNSNTFKLVEAGKTFDDIHDIYMNEFEIGDVRIIIASSLYEEKDIDGINYHLFKVIVDDTDANYKVVLNINTGVKPRIGEDMMGEYSIMMITNDKVFVLEKIDYTTHSDVIDKMIVHLLNASSD